VSVQPPDHAAAPRAPTREQESEPAAPRAGMPVAWLGRFARWEVLLIGLLIGVLVYNTRLSPYFWNADNILDDTSNFMEIGILALPMTLIIIAGHIDLSVASNAALCAVVFATRYHAGWNVWVACLVALLVGTLAGLVNGLIITRVRLPSLVVTLGTYALYRGLANAVLGNGEISDFPADFASIDLRYLPGTHIPAPLLIFTGLAITTAVLLHATVVGRYVVAIGNNEQACRFSGVAVDRIVVILFTLSGLLSALAGLILTSRLQTARSDVATNFELDAITAVVLGGANIFGGEGSIPGTMLALFVIGMLQNGMTLANMSSDVQNVAVGALLILAILLPGLVRRGRAALARRRGGEASRAEHVLAVDSKQ
jgi:rhamnose transport system permease protein